MKTRLEIMQIGDSHFRRASRWEECLRVHDEFAAEVERRRPALVIHTGDIYHAAPIAEEQNAVERWLTRIAAVCPVLIVRGNHDPLGSLAIMRRLETVHPVLVEERCGVHVVAGIAVAAVAWPRKAELVASAPGASPEEIGQLAAQALRNVLSGLGDELAKHDGPRILATHAMVTGAKTSSDQPLVGAEMSIGVEDLALARADYVAIGHVHAFQTFQHGDVPLIYSGSPRRTEYGALEDKGFVAAAFEYIDPLSRWGVAWERVKLAATQMFDVHASFEEIGEGDGGHGWTDASGWPTDEEVRGAEIRLRYVVDADKRALAKLAADEIEARWRAAGAIDVKVEEEVTPVTRARAPEVAAAETTEDQLVAFWKARGIEIEAPRQARLRSKLAEVVGPEEQGARRRGALRFTGIRHRGFATMQPVDIDFDATPGPLVALVGPNGCGKSTTCELLFAACTGDMPTRGTLGTLATARDARLEVGICTQDGERYSIRHDVDAQTRKGTVFLADASGKAVLPDTQVSKFYPWIAQRMPPKSVVAASMFAAQGSDGLLGMDPGTLKGVILRAIGCEALEGWAETCRKNARTAKGLLDVTAARLADERARGVPLKTAELRLAGAEEAVVRALNAVAEAGAAAQRAKVAEEVYREESRALATAKERIEAARATYDVAVAKLGQLETRLAADRTLVVEGAAILEAVGELETLTQREASLREETAKAKADAELAAVEARNAATALADARKRWADLSDRVKKAEENLAAKPQMEAARGRAEALRGEVSVATKLEEDWRDEVTRLQGVALVGAEGRIGKLREGLVAIARHDVAVCAAFNSYHPAEIAAYGSTERAMAGVTVQADDTLAEQARTVPLQLSNAKNAVMAANATKRKLAEALAAAEKLAEGLPALEQIAADLVQLRADLTKATDAGTLAKATDANATAVHVERRGLAASLEASLTPLAHQRATHAPLAARAPELVNATARLEALEPELRAARTAVEAAGNELSALKLPTVSPFQPCVVADTTKAHELAWEGERQAREALAAQQREVTAARASAERQTELYAEQVRHEEDVADWAHLADALGRDGIQALLIDAAGPKLTVLANDLLHSCHGPRFTVRIDAAPFTADGKKQTDGCEIQVTDTKPREDGTVGSDREGWTFSGGERALLNEALGLALTTHVCQRSGLREPTLVRDETGAALDPETGVAYVAMLRRAAAQIGAHRIIFVSHDPALAALADGRIDLGVPRVAKSVAAAESGPAELPKKRRTRKVAA
jgi:DNA repair exonuclease SbcCD ATPase subunit/DNA repair exonuclease SbcCD nuclease subunit